MLSAPRVCNLSGCGQPNMRGTRWCAKHQQENSTHEYNRARWKVDAVYRMYSRAPWPSFRETLKKHNPICQRIGDRGQCHNPATLVHHLQSPRDRPDLFVVPANCVALCAHCHPTSEGTPHWRVGVDYVPTRFEMPHIG